jgi:hypothetical protein
VIAGVDGVLLTGGGDVQPSLYGANPHRPSILPRPGGTSTRWSWCGARLRQTFRSLRSAAEFRC